ncbi:MAG: hypothetical protein V3T88_03225 [Nitrosomonadaceae bacterium]
MTLTRKVNGIEVKIDSTEQVSIEAEWASNVQEAIDEKAANGWERARIADYKSLGTISDQIDIIQKQFQSMKDLGEVTIVTETQTWLDAIAQIKTDNPKPAE